MPSRIVGRDDIISAISSDVNDGDGSINVLCGLGGMGKSAVALEVAKYSDDEGYFVWWISCSTPSIVLQQMLDIGSNFLGISENERDAALKGRINAADLIWASLRSHTNWLLVFDNADDPSVLDYANSSAADRTGWLRSSGTGAVIVTSRVKDPSTWGTGAKIHEVESLASDEGADLLFSLAPKAGTISEAHQLAERLTNLPLALHQAGMYIASPFTKQHTFESYRTDLDAQFSQLLGSSDNVGAENMRSTVSATWEFSIQQLERNGHEGCRQLLEILSCYLPSVPIPAEMITGIRFGPPFVMKYSSTHCWTGPGWLYDSSYVVDSQLKALRSVGLIDVDVLGNPDRIEYSVVVHPLVAESVWRQVHQFSNGVRSRRHRHRHRIAKRAIGGAAMASVIANRIEDKEHRALVWNLILAHIAQLLINEADFLNRRELAELLLAAERGVVRIFSEPFGGLYQVDDGWAIMHLMDVRAQPWGTSWYWAHINLKFANLDRYYYLESLLSGRWYQEYYLALESPARSDE